MAWPQPDYDRSEVNRCARLLTHLPTGVTVGEIDHALNVVNNWRGIHGCPLQSMRMTLLGRAFRADSGALISQRTKRIPAILLKLRENHKAGMAMKLTQMQDIGGCRAVLRNAAAVEQLRDIYLRATAKNPLRGGIFHSMDDYIAVPKKSGYRGVHLIYRYHSDAPSLKKYNDLKIEIQIRSKLQHYWATAVETVDFFTRHAIKSNLGPLPWRNFFALVGSEFARLEKRPLVAGAPVDAAEARHQLKSYVQQITALEGFQASAKMVTDEAGKGEGNLFLLELDLDRRRVRRTSFPRSDISRAQEAYLQVESKARDNPNIQAVLVSVERVNQLRKAYPSFFLDIDEFVKVLKSISA